MNFTRRQFRGFAIAALVTLFLLSPLLHARVLLNHPSFGGELEVLVEGEPAPANATITAPDGQRVTLPFENGQLRYRLRQAGAWEVEVGARKYSLTVPSQISSSSAPASISAQGFELPLYLAIATLIGMAISAVAIYFLFMRPPKHIPPLLEKKREGETVRIRLMAGTLPLSEIMLEDEVGKGFKDGPKRMARAKLEAGQTMELSYAWAGQLGEVLVRFLMDEMPFELKVSDGVVMLKESDALEGGENESGAHPPAPPASASSAHSSYSAAFPSLGRSAPSASSPASKKPHAGSGRKLSRRNEN